MGTVAIAITANIGDTAILGFDSYFHDSVVGIEPHEHAATPEFVELSMRFLQVRLRDQAPETAQKNINLEVLRPLWLPVPQFDLQRRFSAVFAKAAQQTDLLAADSRRLSDLSYSLLHRAFRGEL